MNLLLQKNGFILIFHNQN